MTEPTPEVTYAPRGELLRGAWAYPDDLDEKRRGKLGDEEWGPVLLAASELLYAYSGRLYAGTFTDRARLVDSRRAEGYRGSPGVLRRPGFSAFRAQPPHLVRLPGDPVVRIVSVTEQTAALAPELYELEQPNRLRRVDGRSWRCDGRTVVEFEHGLPPTELGVQACLTYAYELARARTSDKGCRLPEAVQTVTRQGVTYSIVDRANTATHGRTGLPEVDQWLESVNPLHGSGEGARPRRGGATLISADLPPMARLIPDAT